MDTQLEPDFDAPFSAWKATPTPATSGALLRSVSPVIDTAMRSYGGAGVKSPNLRSRARQMALKAFGTYDPQRGSMKTHLLSQLQSLRRASAQEQQMISRPEQVGLDFQHLLSSENELRDELGRDPSDMEIADRTGLSFKRLKHIRQSQLPVMEGRFSRQQFGDQPSDLPASTLPGQDDDETAWGDFIYGDLGTTDRVIMDYALARNGSPQLETGEIAKRLGITAGAVSQRKAKIQALLDARQELGG